MVRAVIRPLAFALGGAIGSEITLLVLQVWPLPGGSSLFWNAFWNTFGQDSPPGIRVQALFWPLLGSGLGVVGWVGYMTGRACWWRFPALRPLGGARTAVLAAPWIGYALLGAGLGVLTNVFNTNTTLFPERFALLAFVVGVPLGHGFLSGFMERTRALATGLLGLLHGFLAGLVFGLAGAIVFVATYQVPPCHNCRIVVLAPPAFIGIFLLAILMGIGVAAGIITGCAEGIGLWLGFSWREKGL